MDKNSILGRAGRLRETLAPALVQWFERSGRDLPWRADPSPYKVLVSEVMLQQTRVDTVLPYFDRWMRRFPNPEALARATEDQVLKAWEGLGYYRRALNLRRAAWVICERHGGRVPADHAALLALPGVGAYTAGAIMSFAHNLPFAAADVNVRRVLARVFKVEEPVRKSAVARVLDEAAARLIPEGYARTFNSALMELGAVVCTAKSPACAACPARSHCLAAREGKQDRIPVKPPKKPSTPIQVVAGVLEQDGRVLVQKRPRTGLMPGLWEFPGGKLEPGETAEDALVREFMEELCLAVEPLGRITTIRHAYTRFSVTLHVLACRMDPPGQQPCSKAADEVRFVKPDKLSTLAFPAADKKLIKLLQKQREE
ncbi:MAG: A/G-specific adenine glycosylase [Deltaproteobacteria bacterium]|nr:A/G-specific adenine glycosylase [Deltaproteobacteria bacterium]